MLRCQRSATRYRCTNGKFHRAAPVEPPGERCVHGRADEGFFIDIAGILAQRDWLQLSFLEIDGRKAAALFSFSYNQSYQIYNSGYDPELYGQFSPGIVLIAYCIQCAIGRGLQDV